MSSGHGGEAFRIFSEAIERSDEERGPFLDRVCGEDEALRAEVHALLERHDLVTDETMPLDLQGADRTASIAGTARDRQDLSAAVFGESEPAAVGGRIASYQIVGTLGEGGMGEVYLASQQNPARHVALKVIRGGIVSPAAIRRFAFEAETLGRLNHIGIAQIYEAGVDEGMHFFAMELVEGATLVDHANAHDLDVNTRLELVAGICDAVEYAHQRGVIHRDLKPSNILVNEAGLPKILDFGIARATDSDLNATIQQTQPGHIVGTLTHMAPEQASGRVEEIDTRVDVYALGVIAYELVAGELPLEFGTLTVAGALRLIQDHEPRRPSLSDRSLRGDVETILLKALEKEKERRYQSASALAADIRRYLAHEPITARPASATYQLRKFAQRNRVLVGGILAVFIALMAGVITTSIFAYQENVRRQNLASVVDFLKYDILGRARPDDLGDELRAILDPIYDEIFEDDRFAEAPWVRAEILMIVGNTYRRLDSDGQGDFERARRSLEEALVLRREILGDDDPDTLLAVNELAAVFNELDDFDRAEPLYLEALQGRKRVLGDHADTIVTLNDLGHLYAKERRYADATRHLDDALAMHRRLPDRDERDGLTYANNHASLLFRNGKSIEEEEGLEAALPWYETAADRHRAVLEIRERLLGPDHAETIVSKHNLGGTLSKLGRYDEARPLNAAAAQYARETLPADNYRRAAYLVYFGRCLTGLEEHVEAERNLREALTILESKNRGPSDDFFSEACLLMAEISAARGDVEEAAGFRAKAAG